MSGWANFFTSKGYDAKRTATSFEIFINTIIVRIAAKVNKHHYPDEINFTGDRIVGWVQKEGCFNGESVRCYCSHCQENPNSLLNK